MLDVGLCLRWYKRQDVQVAMLATASKREVAVRFGERGFGKRPDMLSYPKDVVEFAKRSATSFHVSEEHWENPLMLKPGLGVKQLDQFRVGWDLVIDIDCPMWRFSKIISAQVVKELQKYDIKSISVKFSGNKGFHIAVPMASFPEKFKGIPIYILFPEAPQKIALYLTKKLEEHILEILTVEDKQEIATFLGKVPSEVFIHLCKKCGSKVEKHAQVQFICPKCGKTVTPDKDQPYMICDKDKTIMDKRQLPKGCVHCGSTEEPKTQFDISSILAVDTALISARHLYRMVYSLHEKSGLASIPIDPNKVMEFEKSSAEPNTLKVLPEYKFLDDSNTIPGEASAILIEAYDFAAKEEKDEKPVNWKKKNYEIPKDPVQGEFFPPCIRNIQKGLVEGRKRSMFILLNFLGNMGWEYPMIEQFMIDWNKNNPEPLKEGMLKSHLLNFKRKKEIRLPPNCDREGYYKDIGICTPDELCKRIKNPANYYRLKLKKGRKKK